MSAPSDRSRSAVHDAYLNLGLVLRQAQRFDEATTILEHAAFQFPRSGAIQLALGLVALDCRNLRDARRAFRSALRVLPSDDRATGAAAYLGLGNTFRAAKHHRGACLALSRAIELGDNSIGTGQLLADSLARQRQWAGVISAIDKVLEQAPADAQSLALKAESLRELGRYDEAIQTLDQAFENGIATEILVISKVETLDRMGRQVDALDLINGLANQGFMGFPLLIKQADLLRALGRINEALAAYDQAIEVQPESTTVLLALKAEVLLSVGRYTEALPLLDQAIARSPDFPQARLSRASIYQHQERFNEALEDLDVALKLGFKPLSLVHDRRGEILQTLGDFDMAVECYSAVLQQDPTNVLVRARRGECYHQMGCYEEAVLDFDQILECDPVNVGALGNRGEAYIELERYSEAGADLSQAQRLAPTNAWVVSVRGELHLLCGNFVEAVADFSRAVELDSDNDRYYYLRGLAYKGLGQNAEATAEFLDAIRFATGYQKLNPRFHPNNFDIALYHLVIGEVSTALELYAQYGAMQMSPYLLYGAQNDIRVLLRLFPDIEQGGAQEVLNQAIKSQPRERRSASRAIA